jgi:alginate O-acetyltransferase complex protein AlgI
MLFNSYIFLFGLLPVVLIGWWGLRGARTRLAFLTVASWVFYSYWDWRFLPLMLMSTTVDYIAGGSIAASDDPRRRKLWLIAALTFNLTLLGYFKYAGFFLDSLDGFARWFGLNPNIPIVHIVLPIGISFYTFNSMSYTIDVYRRQVKPAKSAIHYAAFVAMFPHLIAGPIVRYSAIEDQLANLHRRLTWELAASGLFFFACGMVKKLLIADNLAPHVDKLFNAHSSLGLVSGWAAAVGYSLQLYFDFSGYSDMAVGLAFLLGFRFPQNFDSPFKSVSISDFWRRWHMTLSFWLRDYLFIPLGGSRGTRFQTLRNLGITMFLGGLWHGAQWTFVIWGLLHGCFLVIHNLARGAGLTLRSKIANRTLTFACACSAFVIFRSPDMSVAGDVLRSMFGLRGMDSPASARALVPAAFALMIAGLLVFVNVAPNTWEVGLRPRRHYGLALGIALGIAVLTIGKPSPFLYFQF